MTASVRAATGDIFKIPVSEDDCCYGRVVDRNQYLLYLAVMEDVWKTELTPSISDLVSGNIVLAALSTDAMIWHGRWPIVGNDTRYLEKIVRPIYKLEYLKSNETKIVSMFGDEIQDADPDQARILKNQKVVAPIRLGNAAKALNGFGEWLDKYEDLRYSSILRWAEVLGGQRNLDKLHPSSLND